MSDFWRKVIPSVTLDYSNSGHGTIIILSVKLSSQSIVAKFLALHLSWISIQDQGSVEYPQA